MAYLMLHRHGRANVLGPCGVARGARQQSVVAPSRRPGENAQSKDELPDTSRQTHRPADETGAIDRERFRFLSACRYRACRSCPGIRVAPRRTRSVRRHRKHWCRATLSPGREDRRTIQQAPAKGSLPSEYRALELTHAEPWTALDSAAVAKLLAFGLSFDLSDINLTVTLASYEGAGSAAGFDGRKLFFEDLFRSAPFDPAATIPDSSTPLAPVCADRRHLRPLWGDLADLPSSG